MNRFFIAFLSLLISNPANSGTDLIGFGHNGSSGSGTGRVVTRPTTEAFSQFTTAGITAGITADQLLGSSFIDINTGWAVGRSGSILKVSNASSNSTIALVDQTDTDVSSSNLQDVHFINQQFSF